MSATQTLEIASTPTSPATAHGNTPAARGPRLGFTVGTKLIALIAGLLLISLAAVIGLATDLFTDDTRSLINQMNTDTAQALASRTRDRIEALNQKSKLMGSLLTQQLVAQATGAAGAVQAASLGLSLSRSFEADPDLIAVYLQVRTPEGTFAALASSVAPELALVGDRTGAAALAALTRTPHYSIGAVAQGEVQLTPFRLPDGRPALALSAPFMKTGTQFTHLLTTVLKPQAIAKAFSDERGAVTPYLVDRSGRVLAHVNPLYVQRREPFGNVAIVAKMLSGRSTNDIARYRDPRTKKIMLGAYRLVGVSGLGVVSEVEAARATEVVDRVQLRSALAALSVLFIAFLLGYLFSNSLTRPIRALMAASQRIASGDFAIALRPQGDDEIAHLSLAFNDMAQGLAERDRVKDVFNKFHNKEIAERLLSGDVKLGGERREAVIFFSDVRGFTAMSETMQPEQVVEMLNEYLTRMVSIIRVHGGVVDKYVGDAIMALWGVPLSLDDEAGTPQAVSRDAQQAVRACLAMREELARLNELRLARGQNALKIGMGLNRGPVIAGNIGSTEKMEYTVIGDSVNLASRVESMTKEYGTDLLISGAIADRLGSQFVLEPCEAARVKGKSEAIILYRVRGEIDAEGRSRIIETPYSSYASEKSDKAVHADPEPTRSDTIQVSLPAPEPVSAEIPLETELGDVAASSVPEVAPAESAEPQDDGLTDPSISIELAPLPDNKRAA